MEFSYILELIREVGLPVVLLVWFMFRFDKLLVQALGTLKTIASSIGALAENHESIHSKLDTIVGPADKPRLRIIEPAVEGGDGDKDDRSDRVADRG